MRTMNNQSPQQRQVEKNIALRTLLPKEEVEKYAKYVPNEEKAIWDIWPEFVRDELVINRQKTTLKGSKDSLKNLIRYGKVYSIKDLTVKNIKDFLYYGRESNKWKSLTYNSHHSKISSFCNYLVQEGFIESNPVSKVRRCSLDNEYRPTLTEREINQVTGCLTRGYKNSFVKLRDLIFIILLSETGCRSSEALKIKVEDIDYEKGKWKIRPSKGGGPRILTISKNLASFMVSYLKKRKELNRYEDEFFISIHKKGKAWTYSGVRKMIERLRKKSQVQNLTCHSIRRYVATKLAENGSPKEEIQKLLGHKRTSTTEDYIQSVSPKYLEDCNKILREKTEDLFPET